ncbi:concanavalin A-like lectin/glucanase domain-containing protein [Gaertneriomyces semiglobifer]|nr:concanavalin A-like lectin/glucanase domain-containing protein [Gaertneriomyces semiglobifer]
MTNASSQPSNARRSSLIAQFFRGHGSDSSASNLNASSEADSKTVPVRVKTTRGRSIPEYLADSPIATQLDNVEKEDWGRKRPLFTALEASSFDPLQATSPRTDTSSSTDISVTSNATQKPRLLPSQWNAKDKSQSLELSGGCLRVTYTGPGQTDAHAAAVRADQPIPPQCGLYYYEVTVISKGRDGYIGIGICAPNVPLNRLPGWEDNSYGYHGDDGCSFCCSGTGEAYGPVFTTGDVIGCMVNFQNKSVSFTKNGVYLGVAFKNLADSARASGLFPSIGLRTPGEIVEANFGQHRFKFDIEHYYKEEKAKLWQAINSSPLPPLWVAGTTPDDASTSSDDKSPEHIAGINELILSYLTYHGYSQTATSFHRSTIIGNKESDDDRMDASSTGTFSEDDMKRRQAIRDHILEGDIDAAVLKINEWYPELLQTSRHLDFKLRCLKFTEIVRSTASSRDAMDVDNSGSGATDASPPPEWLQNVVSFGQEMQREFGFVERDEVREALIEAYSLVAYPDPFNSPVSYLLDTSNRQLIVDAVNSAILVCQNHPPVPAVEMACKQAAVVINELVNIGNGGASLLNVEKDCLM